MFAGSVAHKERHSVNYTEWKMMTWETYITLQQHGHRGESTVVLIVDLGSSVDVAEDVHW